MTGDPRWMGYAVRLGHRALGTTAENPPVGCVIVREGRVLGVGWTMPGGRPHAETEALRRAGPHARNADVYVTLEPCAHHGRTPPCADALVTAGVSRVFIAVGDPDPRTAGRGVGILRRAGVDVDVGLLAEEARADLSGFLSRMTRKRPYVILKLAVSADGMIAARPGVRTAITGREAGRLTHLWRAQCDAVLIGLSTALIDDPDLTCRLPGLEDRSPIRVVADSRLSIPPRLRLVQTADRVPLWLLSGRKGSAGGAVRVIDCRETAEGWVDLGDGLARLAEQGINTVLVEGGSHVARSLLDAGLVDEFRLFRSPDPLGKTGIDALAGLPLQDALASFRETGRDMLGRDALTIYRKGE